MLPDEDRKKKLAVRHNKTPPDAKLKKKIAAKHSKTPPDAKRKKKPSYENRFKKPVDIGRINSNHNPFRSSPETNNPQGKVHRSTTIAMEPFNVPPMVLSGTQPV